MASQFITHVTASGDRWDLLAWSYYGDPTQYAAIIAANPAVAISAVLPAGTPLAIPLLQASQVQSANMPPWKTGRMGA